VFRLAIRASNLFNVWPVSRVEFAILSLRQVHSDHPPSLARLEPNQFNVNTKHHSNTTSASLFLQALTSSTDLQHFNTSSTSISPPRPHSPSELPYPSLHIYRTTLFTSTSPRPRSHSELPYPSLHIYRTTLFTSTPHRTNCSSSHRFNRKSQVTFQNHLSCRLQLLRELSSLPRNSISILPKQVETITLP
jgi:hypothetical protein